MRIILVFSIFLLYLIFFVHSVYARFYVVQPVILMPEDWESRITADRLENEFKPNILNATKEVKKFYGDKLNGHSFNVADSVQVRKVNFNAGDLKYLEDSYSPESHGRHIGVLFDKLGGYETFPPQEGVVYSIWIVGSENMPFRTGWPGIWPDKLSYEYGYAMMNDQDIRNLYKGADPRQRNMTLGILAHELGHAFGLVNLGLNNQRGFTKAHICSVISIDECERGALPICYLNRENLNQTEKQKCEQDLEEQLPSDSEWEDNVMGRARNYPFNNPPNIHGFTNNRINPVVANAYLSPFLNPNKDPGPTPKDLEQTQKERIAQDTSYKKAAVPTFTQAVKVFLTCSVENRPVSDVVVQVYPIDSSEKIGGGKSYKDGIITFPLPGNYLAVNIVAGEIQGIKPQNQNYLLLLGKEADKDKDGTYHQIIHYDSCPVSTLNVKVRITCEDNQPVANHQLDLGQISSSGYLRSLVTKAVTDGTGQTSLSYTLPVDLPPYETFELRPALLNGQGVDEVSYRLKTDTEDWQVANFHFKQCDANKINPVQEDAKQILSDDTPQQLLISNSDDFTSSSTEVVDNPQGQQAVWTPPQNGNSDTTYVRVVEKDGDVKDYSANLNDGDSTEVGGVKIVAKIPKKVKEIDAVEIGDETNRIVLYTIEGGYQNPEIGLKNDLNLYKIVTIFNDETEEEDSSFYIEKETEPQPPAEEEQ